jgi:hypothetical protein
MVVSKSRGNYSWNITDSQRGVSAYSDPNLITSNGENGRFLQNKYENTSTYGDVLLVGSPKLSEDISLDFMGGSINTSRNTVTEIDNAYLAAPNLFTVSNLQWNVNRGVGDGFHNIIYSTKNRSSRFLQVHLWDIRICSL